ncbi:hypothetical protein C8J57DRAFT_1273731 [Mycena rebaudengoi]|nr:hypothetical protein C8J57DRAFT_1273731 [Mycena rebaudengoi]
MSLHLHLHMHRTRLHARLALLLTSCMDDGVLCTNCPRCYSGGYKAAKRAVDRKSRRRRLKEKGGFRLKGRKRERDWLHTFMCRLRIHFVRPVVLARRACSTQP